MQLSDVMLRKIGFQPLEAGETITATFDTVEVLSIRGPKLEPGTVLTRDGTLGAAEFVLGVGSRINEVARKILADDYCDDEKKWLAETKAHPPFALVRIGKTEPVTCSSGYTKERPDGTLEVYEGFDRALELGAALRAKYAPRIASAVACVFSARRGGATVKHVQSHTAGTTTDGRRISVFKITSHAELTVQVPMEHVELSEKLDASVALARAFDEQVATFFWMGLNEPDAMKRFLFFFLAIEIETNRAYKALTAQQVERRLGQSLVGKSVATLVVDKHVQKTIRARFIWCAAHHWDQVTEDDVAQFERLVKARNDIAHGNVTTVERALVTAAEALATKLHQPR